MAEGDFIAPDDPAAIEAASGLQYGKASRSRYRHDLTHEQILRHACRGGFTVSRQYRQNTLRQKVHRLKERGLLSGGRQGRYGDGHSYRITTLGKAVLHILEQWAKARKANKETPTNG